MVDDGTFGTTSWQAAGMAPAHQARDRRAVAGVLGAAAAMAAIGGCGDAASNPTTAGQTAVSAPTTPPAGATPPGASVDGTSPPASPSEWSEAASTVTPQTWTAPVSTTTDGTDGPVEVVDGTVHEIGRGMRLPDAIRILGVSPIPASDLEPEVSDRACTSTAMPWVVRTGGLTLVFEGPSPDRAWLTNWWYSGGPAAGFTEVLAPHGVAIGERRDDVIRAYGAVTDLGEVIDVVDPAPLRFGLDGDRITWFGVIDCATEVEPPDGG
jgi:hypothetical protein